MLASESIGWELQQIGYFDGVRPIQQMGRVVAIQSKLIPVKLANVRHLLA